MTIKVAVVGDYKNDFGITLKALSPNNDSRYQDGDIAIIYQWHDGKEKIESDYVLVLNKALKDFDAISKRIICLHQEPYVRASKQYALPAKNEWAILPSTYNNYDCVLSFNDNLFKNINSLGVEYIRSLPYLYFGFNPSQTYSHIASIPPPKKTKQMSAIASFDKRAFYEHLDRIKFITALKKSKIAHKIDFYGNKTERALPIKQDGILPYKYTIAIENIAYDDYLSEKIMDAYLGWSIPIYFGAPNAQKYFPKNSYVEIDIYDFKKSLKIIEELIDSDFYERNFEALKEARRLVLEEYSMINGISKWIIKDFEKHGNDAPKRRKILKYRRSLKSLAIRYYQIIWYGFLKILTNGEGKYKLKEISDVS